jgi:hypothetical protein
MGELLNHNNFYKENWVLLNMVKKAIFALLFLVLFINIINATEINLISPRQGDVDEEDIYPNLNQFCDVDWECTAWGKCVNGHKTRVCIDENNCQYKYNIPVTKMDCKEPSEVKYVADTGTQIVFFGFFTGLLLLILLIVLLGLKR